MTVASMDTRPRCEVTGKVVLNEHGARAIETRTAGELEAYACDEHWHVGHRLGRSRAARHRRSLKRQGWRPDRAIVDSLKP